MKTNLLQTCLLAAALLALPAMVPISIAQAVMTLTTLHTFYVSPNGAYPKAGLVQGSDGNFYGTTYSGGTYSPGPYVFGYGSIFKISTNGAMTRLYSFTGGTNGANPSYGKLAQGSDGNFYGTTVYGGTTNFNDGNATYGNGTVFKISTNGVLTTLYEFTGANDGTWPEAGLVQGSNGYFYGTTLLGGTNDWGTVFKISTNGVLTTLHEFTGGNDGGNPEADLVLGSDGCFYGTTAWGGTSIDWGTVFKISTNGVLTTLHSFAETDGQWPSSGLVQGNDGYFYGTTGSGGKNAGFYAPSAL